jgi:outer membrane receptor protein involved in Fe transport
LFFPPVADFPNASTDVYAGFVELGAPILDSVDLQLALRYENYGGQVGDTLDPKASLRWRVFDGFSVRGSAGTSFRAPTPLQLGGSTTQVTPITNPCTGQRTAAAVVTAGNADLAPEDSTSYGAGVVFDRGGFRASIDYYRYDYEDVITRGDPQAIASAAICTTIAPGRRVPIGPGVVLNPTSGQIAQINTAFFNAGAIQTDGVDFNVGYRFPLGPAGDLDIDVTATLITSFDIQETQGGPVIDGLDSRNALNFARSTPDFRLNANLMYDFDQHQLGVIVRHIDGYVDDLNGRAPIDSFTTLDMQYSYRFDDGLFGLGDETALTVGALNLTAEDPPFVNDRGSYDPVVHDPRGRLFYVRVRQSF